MIVRVYRILFFGIIALIFLPKISSAQIVINEICPTNKSLIVNSNAQYDDWIEIQNSGTSPIDLHGYGLTDDTTKPFRFMFPSYNLGAGQKVIVFASDFNNTLIVDHWEMPVNAGSFWNYISGSAAVDTNWRNLSFNAGSFSTGYAGIGFGDGDENTTIPVGVSVMMRKTFNIPDTSQVLKAILLMDYDDGFVAYLNGVEIARANIGKAGFRPSWNDLASNSHEANSYRGLPLDSFYISPDIFKSAIRPGNNVLAIEVHNTPANSDDMTSIPYLFFGMKSSGITFSSIPSWFHVPSRDYFNAKFKLNRFGEILYLYNPSGLTVDQKGYPVVDFDNSYCRIPDGSSNWCLTNTPTPNGSNNASTCYSGYAYSPVFSKQGGYYSSTQTITISTSTPGGVIRYSTNGNTPTSSSPVYSSPLVISSNKTVRAKVFANGLLPSPMVTNSYIINGNTHLCSFSITTDSVNLWDYNTGIYVMGPGADSVAPYRGANFWQNWEKPVTIEYYDHNKNQIVKFDADISIYGNYSRAKPQKSFEIKLKNSFGVGSFIYPMYSDKQYVDNISNIILRNSGTDWNKVHFRDGMMERIMKPTFSGYLAAQPAIAYLNGAYWGVYCIDENHDQHWMRNNFGYDKSEIDYLKEAGTTITVEQGSDSSFWSLYNYATTQSPSTQQYYDKINASLDLKNYTDYFACETFYNNGDWIGDWTNNIKMWRPNKAGSKWKYLLYDLDFGLGLKGTVNDNRLALARNPSAFSSSSEMFDAILQNPTYKRYFINRYADLMNTVFLPSNMNTIMHTFKDTMSFDMTAHFAKWGSSSTTWNTYINDMMNFANARPDIMKNYIKSEFSLAGVVTLTILTSPAGSGRIEISTITPTTYPWSGDYFNGNPVTITAIPNPGFTFDHWKSTKVITTNNPNQSVTYNFNKDDKITAYFTGSSVTPKICISELNYNSSSAYNAGDWIELHNFGTTKIDISGWRLSDANDNHNFVFPTGTTIPINGYIVLVEDSNKFKSQFPAVTNRIGETGFNFSNAGDQLRLFNPLNVLYESFNYQDLAPWPVLADGQGYTCELTNNLADPNNGASWFAGCIGGSPGVAYSPIITVPVSVSGSTTFCGGSSSVLHASYFQGSTYQWKKNNTNISGAIDSIYSATQGGSYSVSILNHGCSALTPAVAINMVTQQPVPTTNSASRCGAGELTLTATSSDSVFWYDAPTAGNLVASGNNFLIPYLSQSKTYYARTGKNCPSNSVATLATIIPPAASPVASDVARCGPGIVTINATDTAEIRWYNASSGGGLLATGPSFTTNVIENDTVYFVEAGSVCPSSRIDVHVTVNSTPEPTASDASRCGDGMLTLTANSSSPVFWYSDLSGGTSVGSGSSFTTPVLALTDTFYAEANSGCPSARVMSIAIVNPIPPDPITADVVSCSPGSLSLTADATEQVMWYNAPTGGTLLSTGSIFNTPVLTNTTTYYAVTGYSCTSNRVPVQAIVSSPPSSPVAPDVINCDTGIVTLNASSLETIYWYDSLAGGNLLATGASFITPSLTSTTTYYTEAGTYCRSQRIPVQAVISQTPAAPTLTGGTRCGSGSILLNASSTVNWFNVASGGTAIGTGLSYNTPSLQTTTTYYAETNNGYCSSQRLPVQATVTPIPQTPVITAGSRCDAGTVTLSANSSSTVNWYTSATGGTMVGTGTAFTTPVLNNTTTYYAEAFNGCSSVRSPAIATVNITPSAPVTSDVSRCGPGTVVLTSSSTAQVNWFNVSTGGSSIGSGLNFTTPSLTANQLYYAEAYSGNCRSSRVPVQAIIHTVPAMPSTSDNSICGPGIVTLNATATAQLYWYDAPFGGSPVDTGNVFLTPLINGTTDYYVEANNGYCSSGRVVANAIINPVPAAPLATSVSRCNAGDVTLTASSPEQIYWYDALSGGNLLDTGVSYTTTSLTTNTDFYVEAGSTCRSARILVQALVTIPPSPPVLFDTMRCGPGSAVIRSISPVQVNWYDAPSGGILLDTGSYFTTPLLNGATTFYAEAGLGCNSARVPVNVILNTVPNPPAVTGGSHCGPGSIPLQASSPETIYWYDSATGNNPVATGASFTTPVLNATTGYYVEASSVCNSARIPVMAAIYAVPVINLGPDTIAIPGGQTIILDAGQGFASYHWSTNETNSYIQVSAMGYYSVIVTNNNGCSASDGIFVNSTTSVEKISDKPVINVYPNPAKGQVTVEMLNLSSKPFSMKLISIDGKTVLREEINSQGGQFRKTLNISHVSAGVYFLSIENDTYSRILKVVIE